MDDPLLGLAAVLAAGGNDLLTGLQLSEAQRSLGLSPHLVFLAGVALALPVQVDGGTAAFSAEQERTFARLQISYDQACQRIGAPPHPTRLYKLSPLLVPAQPLSITELLRVSTTPADSTASSEEGTYPAGPAPTASETALAAASAAAAAAATQLLAEERRAGAATSVSCLRAKGNKSKGRVKVPKPAREPRADQPGREQEPPSTSDRTLAELAAPPLCQIDAAAFDAAEWTEVSVRRRHAPQEKPATPAPAQPLAALASPRADATPACETAAASHTE